MSRTYFFSFQVCVEGNIASGKTSFLKYFDGTSDVEVRNITRCLQMLYAYRATIWFHKLLFFSENSFFIAEVNVHLYY